MISQPIKEVTLTRIFDAPPVVVFKVWTDETLMTGWWGSAEYRCKLDAWPGGAILIDKIAGDTTGFPILGIFYEVDEPSRIVFSSLSFENADGSFGLEIMHTITMEEINDGKTKFTIQLEILKITGELQPIIAGMEQGWNESLNTLAAFVKEANAVIV